MRFVLLILALLATACPAAALHAGGDHSTCAPGSALVHDPSQDDGGDCVHAVAQPEAARFIKLAVPPSDGPPPAILLLAAALAAEAIPPAHSARNAPRTVLEPPDLAALRLTRLLI